MRIHKLYASIRNLTLTLFILGVFAITIYSCANTNIKKELKSSKALIYQNKGISSNFEFISSAVSDSNKILFSINLKREKEGKEYFANSEQIRLEIFNDKSELVWASNSGVNFMQVISAVLPEKTGDDFTYLIEWNLKNKIGEKAPNGDYKAKLTLLTKPKFL